MPPMERILLVKTSSLGDVVHNLPVVSDIRRHFPRARVDWVVEEAYATIPALHPGVTDVIPVALRRWRRSPLARAVRAEVCAFRNRLQARAYDAIVDTQGLVKSGCIVRLARGSRMGYDRRSAWEPLATLAYQHRFRVPTDWHAVMRNRALVGLALGYAPDASIDYGVSAALRPFPWAPAGPYALLLHATSRADKEWPIAHWVELGQRLRRSGLAAVLPAGSATERARSERIAHQIDGAVVPPPVGIDVLASLLAGAETVVGVDTGLTHLGAALGRPTVAIYTATEPSATGVFGARAFANLGGPGTVPGVDVVLEAAVRLGVVL
jgi:heptosyltransferase I